MHQITRLTTDQSLDSALPAFCQSIAEQVRTITGYDRVMIYQFDDDGNGEVIGEAREPTIEPFLGLCYPASDIPAKRACSTCAIGCAHLVISMRSRFQLCRA